MFISKELTISDWFLYRILMLMPGVNIVVFIIVLLSSSTNKTLRNMLVVELVFNLIIVTLVYFLFLDEFLIIVDTVVYLYEYFSR
jgi:hypothetical protein